LSRLIFILLALVPLVFMVECPTVWAQDSSQQGGANEVEGRNGTNSEKNHSLDLSDQGQVRHALEEIKLTHGIPDVFIHNAAELFISPLEDTSVDQFEQCWRAGTMSAFVLAKELLPKMVEKGGTAIFTGATASIRGGINFSAFSSAKFALRGLVQSLARQYQSSGLHIAHILVDGIIDTEKSRKLHSLPVENMINPTDIAECYWQLTQQPESAWTHELDLRPYSEKF
jgi:NAD(P)-dependent dehydrogenase (short-subunit alcohol dehydrogenase family)